MRKCTSLAPASRIMRTIFTEVVPRTMKSSTSTMRLPSTTARLARVLHAHAEFAHRLRRLDEGAADIMVADDAELVGHAACLREAERGRHAGIGHRHDDVGVDRRFARRARAHALAHVVDAAAVHDRVGPGEVDVFEDAGPRRLPGAKRIDSMPVVGDDDDLAVLDVADEAGADDVERAGLRARM